MSWVVYIALWALGIYGVVKFLRGAHVDEQP